LLSLFAFSTLGFLIGTLTAFTADSVVSSLIPLFFAFAGGSAIAFGKNFEKHARDLAALAILGLSIGCVIGVYSGIYVFERKLLTPQEMRETRDDSAYLRKLSMDQIDLIDQQKRSGILTTEQAYAELTKIIRRSLEE
jgi:Na+/glutamate symporter